MKIWPIFACGLSTATLLASSSEPLATSSSASPTTAAPSPSAATSFTPPADKFTPGDTLEYRLDAMQADLNAALQILNQAPKPIHGGFVEKAIKDVNQALADVAKGFAYVSANPALNATWGWTSLNLAHGAMPRPLPAIPTWVGQNYGGVGRSTLVNSGNGADQHLVDALNALRSATAEFSNVFPEMNPYEVGDMGGLRDTIRADIYSAVGDVVAALDFAHTPRTRPATLTGELVLNGGFEDVAAPTTGRNANMVLRMVLSDGGDVSGFGWHVLTGNTFQRGGVTLLQQGYTMTSGASTQTFGAPANDGKQWLVLSGGAAAGCISQLLPTTAGQAYELTFACANNPYPPPGGPGTPPSAATVTVKDTATDADLIKPVVFSHSTSTVNDFHWDRAGPFRFTATGPYTTLTFTPNSDARALSGVFLDSVSVVPVSASAPLVPPVIPVAAPVARPTTTPKPASPLYTITNLGTLGGNNSLANGINNAGKVVGQSDLAGGGSHAFLYENGKMQDLGTLGGPHSEAYAINASGQVVGGADSPNAFHAFLYESGKMQDLGSLGTFPAATSYATAINNSGQIIGNSETASQMERHGFLYSGGKMQDIATMAGIAAPESDARGINDAGDIVGFSVSAHQAYLVSKGKLQDLGAINGSANAINNAGQITGIIDIPNPPGVGGLPARHGFIYTGGKMTDLGNDGLNASFANALNNAGDVVGVMGDLGGNGGGRYAFIYTKGKLLDLNVLAGDANLAKAGLKVLTDAAGINDKGQIVGSGVDVKGNRVAFLLTPVDSSPFVLPGM